MSLVVIPNLNEQAYRWKLYFRSNLYFRFLLRFFNYGKKIKYMSVLPSGRICPYLPKSFINKKYSFKKLGMVLNSLICYHKSALDYYKNTNNINLTENSFYEDVIFSHSLFHKGFK